MPIDILKIDRSFVDRIDQGGDELAFARAIVELARSLSLRTIAEGIELESQAECLGSARVRPRAGLPLREGRPARGADRDAGGAAAEATRVGRR